MYPYQVAHPQKEQEELLRKQGISPLLSKVLAARGVKTVEEARSYIEPSLELVHSPFALENMEKASARLKSAIETGEKIAVYGDYDVDGITSTTLLTHCLREKGGNVVPYIPERMGEGYGLHEISLEDLFRQGIRLVITVDCGISAVDQVDFAKALGMDVIITDHHTCPQQLPRAFALINPRMGDYPFPYLAGVGVALKLAQALHEEDQWEQVFQRYADLVAIGTVADVMPMEGENRYFVREGLAKLNINPSIPFKALLMEAGVYGRTVTAGTIGYTIAPRINAAGRLDQTQIALDLLLTQEEEEAISLVRALCSLNSHRQEIESGIYHTCTQMLEENPPENIVFLHNEQWHPGVVGIVASRLTERFKKPAIMICVKNGIGKGSCRTLNRVNLYEMLSECSDLLLGFGGHAQAAGFTVAQENIHAFYHQLEEIASRYQENTSKNIISLDARVEIPQLTLEEVHALTALEPSGVGCPRACFLLERAEVLGASLVGGGKHLRLRLKQAEEEVSGIFFHYRGEPVYIGAFLDIAFYLQENNFRGVSTPQLRIFSMTLSPEPDAFYQRWKRGGQLTQEEALHLCPKMQEFQAISEYFNEIQRESPVILQESDFNSLCHRLEQGAGLPFSHGEVCLAVLRERGWVDVENKSGESILSLRELEVTTPLENSPILSYLLHFQHNKEMFSPFHRS